MATWTLKIYRYHRTLEKYLKNISSKSLHIQRLQRPQWYLLTFASLPFQLLRYWTTTVMAPTIISSSLISSIISMECSYKKKTIEWTVVSIIYFSYISSCSFWGILEYHSSSFTDRSWIHSYLRNEQGDITKKNELLFTIEMSLKHLKTSKIWSNINTAIFVKTQI